MFQTFFVLLALFYGVFTLFPGIASEKLNKKILSKYASGYNLYNWVNEIIPQGSLILTNHRSTYFSRNDTIFFETAPFLNYYDTVSKNYILEKIKKNKPNFILFYGLENDYKYNSFNFYGCTKGLFKKKINVGFLETRSPFNSNTTHYNAYIYHFDYSKLPYCVKYN